MSASDSSAAVAAARASAAAGAASAQIGYELTQQALKAGQAPLVFPLLALELAAIAAGFTAYIATGAAWKLATNRAQADAARAAGWWSSPF